MKVTSAHFNPKIQPYLKHNDRTNTSSPNIHQELTHLNECTKPSSEVLKEIDKLYDEAMAKLKGTKGKRTPKERSFHEAIFEIAEDTTMEQCQELADVICKLTGFRTLQISIHRDEGHTDLEGNFKTHYHAHAVFFTLDKDTGKQLARQEAALTKYNLSKIQDLASEILGLERGQRGSKKQYISDYREYKAIQQAKTEVERQLKVSFEKQKEELAQKEQEIAQKELEIQNQIKTIAEERKWILRQKEELLEQERNLEKQKEEILGNAENAHEALKSEYNAKYSTIKNIITFGKHRRQLIEEFKKAENFLANQTDKAIREVNHRLNDSNHLIDSLRKQLQITQNNLQTANNTIKALAQQVNDLRARYQPEEIKNTKIQSREHGRGR